MTKGEKEKIKSAAAASVGVGVGGAGGATAGILELAAQGASVTALSAGLVIGAGAVAGGVLSFLGYKLYHRLTKPKS
jgi:hypothetical protein